jgi:hypothetical protein
VTQISLKKVRGLRLPTEDISMRHLLLLAALVPGACGPLPPPADTARIPPGVFSSLDQDVTAINFAAYAFARPARTAGDPVAGARAVLAMDYLAGQLNTAPRWAFIPAITQLQLLQGRQATRAALAIAPDAPSQVVVDSLAVASAGLQRSDRAAAVQALSNPAFTAGPDQTLQVLANLPYIQMANVSTMKAEQQEFERSGPDWD